MSEAIELFKSESGLLSGTDRAAGRASSALTRDFRRDFMYVRPGRYVSVELHTDSKLKGLVCTIPVDSINDESAGRIVWSKPDAIQRNDLVAFKVTVFDYARGVIEHDLIGKSGWVELRTEIMLFVNAESTVYAVRKGRDFRAGVDLLLAELGDDIAAIRTELDSLVRRFIKRVVDGQLPLNQRTSVYTNAKGLTQVTPYGKYLFAVGKPDKELKAALEKDLNLKGLLG